MLDPIYVMDMEVSWCNRPLIVTLLGKKQRATEILMDDDSELYWYGALGGWSDPEMEKMQEHYAGAVQALLSRGKLELADD